MNNEWFKHIQEVFDQTEEEVPEPALEEDALVAEIQKQFEDFLKQKGTSKYSPDILSKEDDGLYDDI